MDYISALTYYLLLNDGDYPRIKTPHRAPPYEELVPATLAITNTDGRPNAVRYQACFCAENLFLEKSTETAATRAALFDSNMHQIGCRFGLRPRPHWESLLHSPRPHSCI